MIYCLVCTMGKVFLFKEKRQPGLPEAAIVATPSKSSVAWISWSVSCVTGVFVVIALDLGVTWTPELFLRTATEGEYTKNNCLNNSL